MALIHKIPRWLLCTLLSGCSLNDLKQLVILPDNVLLIRQQDGDNRLSVVVADDKFTRMNHETFNILRSIEQLPSTPSQSLAVKMRPVIKGQK